MTKTTNLESVQKRDSPKKMRNAGLGTAAVTTALANGWVKPVVDKVILPAHAEMTPVPCGQATITAELLRCSGDGPLEVNITAAAGPGIIIESTPTLTCTPTPNDWGIDVNSPPPPATPAEIDANTGPYTLVYAGSVQNQETCYPPMTDVPLADPPPQPLTSMVVSVTYTCLGDGTTTTVELDVLPTLSAP